MTKTAIHEPGLLESMREDFEEMRRLCRIIRDADARIENYRDMIRDAKLRKEDAILQLGVMLSSGEDLSSDRESVPIK